MRNTIFPKRAPLPAEVIGFYRTAPWIISPTSGFTYHSFDDAMFREIADEWAVHEDRKLKWDWTDWYDAFRLSKNRAEVAIRLDGVLVGLFLGKIRQADANGPARLEVHYLEARPGAHELRGRFLEIILIVAYYLAHAVAVEELRCVDPLPPLIPKYEALGFKMASPASGPPYCTKTLERQP